MNKKYEIEIEEWIDVNFDRISKFAVKVWQAQGFNRTYEQTINWFENQTFDIPPLSISALINGKLIGWLLLVKHNKHEAEINPWALGGHPVIAYLENKGNC